MVHLSSLGLQVVLRLLFAIGNLECNVFFHIVPLVLLGLEFSSIVLKQMIIGCSFEAISIYGHTIANIFSCFFGAFVLSGGVEGNELVGVIIVFACLCMFIC